MNIWIWWVLAGISLVVFLPCGLILLAVVIIKHFIILTDVKDKETKTEQIIKNEYFENTLERFR